MNPANLFPSIRRSLGTAWTKQPEGPRWAPWAWTAALNVVIAALITVLVPPSGGFWVNLVASEAIGMTIHALFVGLGHARAADLRQRALEQAEWEHERTGSGEHGHGQLAIQLWHEFLGAAWKDVSDAQRLQYFDLIEWALPPALRPS